MLNQDPQKKISGITNRPRPVSPQAANNQQASWGSNSQPLGQDPAGTQVPPTSQSGPKVPLAADTPPEQKKGFMAALKDKLSHSAQSKLKERTGQSKPDAPTGPDRNIENTGAPKPPSAEGLKGVRTPDPSPPGPQLPTAPKRPNLPNLPKPPKMPRMR